MISGRDEDIKNKLWELPQNCIGFMLVKILDAKAGFGVYKSNRIKGSISLGNYIIIGTRSNKHTFAHEEGHRKQSKKYGPLYLFIVGIPSITRSIIWSLFKLKPENYYKGWPEKQADELGNIKR